jgi:hypothetical protein
LREVLVEVVGEAVPDNETDWHDVALFATDGDGSL